MMVQDGRLLDFRGNEEKGSLGKQVMGRAEEMEVKKALEEDGWSEGEEFRFVIIPNKFAEFSSFLGCEWWVLKTEIIALLKKMESRKGHGVKVLRGSRKSLSSRLEREIRKLECLVHYNSTHLAVKGKGESSGVQFSHSEVVVLFSLLVCGFRWVFGRLIVMLRVVLAFRGLGLFVVWVVYSFFTPSFSS